MRIFGVLLACLTLPFLIASALAGSGDPEDRCAMAAAVSVAQVKDSQATLTWSLAPSASGADVRWRIMGAPDWGDIADAQSPLVIDGLVACTVYEAQVRVHCANGDSDYSTSVIFEADGCCRIPSGFFVAGAQSTAFTLNWDTVQMSTAYNIQYRVEGKEEWTELMVTTTGTTIEDLKACTGYECRIATTCDPDQTEYSEILIAYTDGCGKCTAGAYCDARAYDASYEWIDSIAFDGLRNSSGSNGGYTAFASEGANLERGRIYPLHVSPGFSGDMCPQYIRVWIDLDQDAVFNDSSELVIDSIDATGFGISGNVALDDKLPLGVTRMRIVMVPVGTQDTITPDPCGVYDFGEVEDYCIRIDDVCPFAVQFDTLTTTENSAIIGWSGTEKAIGYFYQYKSLGSEDYESMATEDTVILVEDLDECTEYVFMLVTICVQDTTVQTLQFRTRCETSTVIPPDFLSEMRAYPNPFYHTFSVELSAPRDLDGHLEVVDLVGRSVYREAVHLRPGQTEHIDIPEISNAASGMYFALFRHQGQVAVAKIVKTGG